MRIDKYRLYAIATVVGLIILTALIWWLTQPEPEKKPVPQEKEKDWYVIFSVQNQKATAYTNHAGNVLSSSGKPYFFGAVAVHPRYPVNAGGDSLQPIIPYDTVLYLKKPLLINGESFSTLRVIDTGDVNYRLYPDSPYWIDVYHGSGDYWSLINSQDFGIKEVDYYWVEKWK
ncbi:MAG TPA: hypothetical protein PLP71_04800 [Syntrophomonadaceae bacterium]|nr:hypothetical protein [Syntrophomonadaceae bacterium]HQD90323.1 hypothetical protein [Syntrophomonadaceae bacterium]